MAGVEPIAWRAIVYGTPVVAGDGTRVGTVHEVLGSDAEDVFHGVRVTLAHGTRDVVVTANDIASITRKAIGTDLTARAIEALPLYDEEATYHLASVGWLRKHVGWTRDSQRDEEPG